METPSTSDRHSRNAILAALPQAELNRIDRLIEPVVLTAGQTLIEPHERIDYVYFPEKGMVSLVQPLADGAMIEVGLVGREGMVGVSLVLGVDRWPVEAMVQMPGRGLRMRTSDLLATMDRSAAFQAHLLRYAQALFIQVMQSGACNSQHALSQRLARWLLMALDRANGDALELSHAFISMMLGIRRASVTVALAKFKAAGILTNRHKRVEILDRAALEKLACECYGTVKRETGRLLGS